MADAALVAARAEDALLLAVLEQTTWEVGIGDQRARHADGIGSPRSQDCLGLDRLVNP